jgi:hypothetical protein
VLGIFDFEGAVLGQFACAAVAGRAIEVFEVERMRISCLGESTQPTPDL